MRRLTPAERALGEAVFGAAIALDRVRVVAGGWGRFAVTLGSHLLIPTPLRHADYAVADLRLQALFIHELTHVWQFQTRPLWTLRSWARNAACGGYGPGLPAYRYTLPFDRFTALNLEQQASMVEHAFLLTRGVQSPAAPAGARAHHYAACSPFPVALAAGGADYL